MSTNKLIINLLVVFCCSFSSLLLPTQDTFAEAICVKKIGRKTRSGTVSLQRSVKKVSSGEACPRGHFLLLDTQTLTPATELTQGDTIRGVVGGAGTSSILQFLPISLPTASPVAIMDEDILIANTSNLSDISGGCSGSGCLSEDQKSKNASVCSGNFDNPTAPAGKLCIYVDVNSDSTTPVTRIRWLRPSVGHWAGSTDVMVPFLNNVCRSVRRSRYKK
jgi:hypothetical protein